MTADHDSDVVTVEEVCRLLRNIAPLRLAEDWDNVGLLLGDRRDPVTSILTCLTLTPDVIDEAVEAGAAMVVTHHPLPFRPLKKITSDDLTGTSLLRLARAGIAVYSAHTAYDSARGGINAQWATRLGLEDVRPMCPDDDDPTVGGGRIGRVETNTKELARLAGTIAGVDDVRIVGDPDASVRRVAIGCGSGGSFLSAAAHASADALVTGEATFHTCLEARSRGVALILVGHHGSERFAMETLAERLGDELNGVDCHASRVESDPLRST